MTQDKIVEKVSDEVYDRSKRYLVVETPYEKALKDNLYAAELQIRLAREIGNEKINDLGDTTISDSIEKYYTGKELKKDKGMKSLFDAYPDLADVKTKDFLENPTQFLKFPKRGASGKP